MMLWLCSDCVLVRSGDDFLVLVWWFSGGVLVPFDDVPVRAGGALVRSGAFQWCVMMV